MLNNNLTGTMMTNVMQMHVDGRTIFANRVFTCPIASKVAKPMGKTRKHFSLHHENTIDQEP
jgi:hypothetical protein